MRFVLKQNLYILVFLLSIGFFITNANAQTITSIETYGTDGVSNTISATNDYFIVNIVTNKAVSQEMVSITYNNEKKGFDSCQNTHCTYTSPRKDRTSQEMTYTITIQNQTTLTILDTKQRTLTIDGVAPLITSFTAQNTGQNIKLKYKGTDAACTTCNACAGITQFSLYQGATLLNEFSADGTCEVSASLEETIEELNLAEGTQELCLVATDAVGLESEKSCVGISVDRTGPYFQPQSFKIINLQGETVSYVGSTAVLTTVQINITDSALDITSVTADLSSLNTAISEEYRALKGSCTLYTSASYFCIWESVAIDGVSGSVQVLFTAKDTAGNNVTHIESVTITKDTAAPKVNSITINEEKNGAFKSGKNTIRAEFEEGGSGFGTKKAYLDLSEAGIKNKQADSCYSESRKWYCVWNLSLSTQQTSEVTVRITQQTSDDAGNTLAAVYAQESAIDTISPTIQETNLSTDCPTGEEPFVITIAAKDKGDSLVASIPGRGIRKGSEPLESNCKKDGDQYTCILSITDITAQSTKENVQITVTDEAGNSAVQTKQVQTCSVNTKTAPNALTITIGEIPEVDKRVLSFMDYPLHVPLTITKTEDITIIQSMVQCDEASANLMGSSQTQNVLVARIKQQSLPEETTTLSIHCMLYFTLRKGSTLYEQAEQEELNITIPLYNLALGTYGASIQDRLDTLTEEIDTSQQTIDTWVKWNTALGWLCEIGEGFAKLNTVIGTVKGVVLGVAIGLEQFPYTKPAGIALWNAVCNAFSRFDSFVVTFIWPPGFGSITSKPIGTIVKYGCLLYSGKICQGFDGIINTGMGFAEGSIYTGYNGEQGKPNRLTGTFTYDWDPYKSINTAANCLFIDAIIYNLRKERQIKCMQRSCIEQTAKTGLISDEGDSIPLTVCDKQYQERECLYVEGAAWKVAGSPHFVHFLQQLMNTVVHNLDWFLASWGYTMTCSAVQGVQGQATITSACAQPSTPQALWISGCHLYGAALSLTELGGIKEFFTWETDYSAPLEGEDYCA